MTIFAAEKFWILDPLYAAFGTVLSWFYALIPSFGVAIMLLTVAVSILRMPLVAKQVKSQREMQRIQPELKRIQAKYKTDPQKRNEEMMKLYKEHNVNPFAGCLPLLLQMPLFIVLYRLILDLGRPEPKHVPRSSDLFEALRASAGKMQSFGMDLAESASKTASKGFVEVLPFLLLIGLVIATGVYQQKQMTARLPKESMNSQIAIMGKIFPVFLGLISWSIPAGVVLYFFVSNLWQIGQQHFLFSKDREEKEGIGSGSAKDPKDKVIKASLADPPADAKPGRGGRDGGGAGGARGGRPNRPKPQPGGKGNAKGNAKGAAQRGAVKGDRKGGGGGGGRSGGSNGRSGSSGGGGGGTAAGRAQAKGTTPQGRSRPRKGK